MENFGCKFVKFVNIFPVKILHCMVYCFSPIYCTKELKPSYAKTDYQYHMCYKYIPQKYENLICHGQVIKQFDHLISILKTKISKCS